MSDDSVTKITSPWNTTAISPNPNRLPLDIPVPPLTPEQLLAYEKRCEEKRVADAKLLAEETALLTEGPTAENYLEYIQMLERKNADGCSCCDGYCSS